MGEIPDLYMEILISQNCMGFIPKIKKINSTEKPKDENENSKKTCQKRGFWTICFHFPPDMKQLVENKRFGGNWYGKATKDSLFELGKPIGKIGMGFDNLPNEIRESSILSGSDLAILASLEQIPSKTDSHSLQIRD